MRAVAFCLVYLAKVCADLQYFDGYEPDAPLKAQMLSEEEREGYRRISFSYEGRPGRAVPALLALPEEGVGPFPVGVFLHGIAQEKEFLDEVAGFYTAEGFALATFDQYMQGERRLPRDSSALARARALRERGSLTVTEARRLVDYLSTRPDIDAERVYLIGASYGAMMAAITGAFEPRFKAVSLAYGGGDLRLLCGSSGVSQYVGPFIKPLAGPIAWFASVCDPVYYVRGISPRPVLFQNGENDRVVTPAAARALQEAALEPKEVMWYPSDHPDASPEYIPIAVQDGLHWIMEQDKQIRVKVSSGR